MSSVASPFAATGGPASSGAVEARASRITEVEAGGLSGYVLGPELRYLSHNGLEIVRRIYAAVRNSSWGTPPIRLSAYRLKRAAGGFSFEASGRCREAGGLDFDVELGANGTSDGVLNVRFEARANVASDVNRIGMCILLATEEYAGRRFQAATTAGPFDGTLPTLVGPQLIKAGLLCGLFEPFTGLQVRLANDTRASFAFSGDVFEMEDQRNWAEPTYKIYSTPLRLGFPRRIEAGTVVTQTMRLEVAR